MSNRYRLLVLLVVAAGAAALIGYLAAPSAPSTQARARATALAYVQKYMVWSNGPQVQTVRLLPVSSLPTALASSVPPHVAQDVNVSDLQRRYGPTRRIALVVLNGVYNSLPPDEGVDIHGDIVVLVNVRPEKVLLLTG